MTLIRSMSRAGSDAMLAMKDGEQLAPAPAAGDPAPAPKPKAKSGAFADALRTLGGQ